MAPRPRVELGSDLEVLDATLSHQWEEMVGAAPPRCRAGAAGSSALCHYCREERFARHRVHVVRVQVRAATRWWTEARIEEQMCAVYRAPSPLQGEGVAEVIAAVFHQDPRLVSRWRAWRARRRGGLAPFCFFGIGWSEHQAGCVAMGDDPIPQLLGASAHQSEGDARAAAVAWITDAAAGPFDHPAFSELQPFARRMLTMVARGENVDLLSHRFDST